MIVGRASLCRAHTRRIVSKMTDYGSVRHTECDKSKPAGCPSPAAVNSVVGGSESVGADEGCVRVHDGRRRRRRRSRMRRHCVHSAVGLINGTHVRTSRVLVRASRTRTAPSAPLSRPPLPIHFRGAPRVPGRTPRSAGRDDKLSHVVETDPTNARLLADAL